MALLIKHFHFDEVTSTQDAARTLCEKNMAALFLVTADAQTAGRGRMGRTWVSPPGNFHGSLVISPQAPSERYSEYGFVIANALRQTIAEFADNITLKWPNDILYDGKKCAGILIEVHDDNLIIGIGVNLQHVPPPEAVAYPAAALGVMDAPKFTAALAQNFIKTHAIYDAQGFDAIRAEWLRHAHGLNGEITVRTPQKIHTGIFTGIDTDGSLLLTQNGKPIKVTTADVLA